jgi:hypothetical protein
MRIAQAREIGTSGLGAARGAGGRVRGDSLLLVAVLALEALLLVVAIAAAILARAGLLVWKLGRGGWRARSSPIPPRPGRAAGLRLRSETAERESKAALVERAVQTVTPRFSARRMVKEYVERLYLPTRPGHRR